MPVFSSNKHKRTVARNTHLKSVPRTIDALTTIVQQHHENSLQADAYPVIVYSKCTTGVKCTCSETINDNATALYDEDGKASPAVIDTILNGARFGIEDYTKTTDVVNVPAALESDNDLSPLLDNHLNGDSDNGLTFTSINSFFNSSCPVCFGTGYVGGYTVLGGVRRILDCSAIVSHDGIEQLRNNTDVIQFLSDTGYVDFTLILPSLTLSIDALRVWNGFVPAIGTQLLQVVGNVEIQPTQATLCTGLPVTLRVRAPDQTLFTHLEVQVRLSDYPYAANYPFISNGFDPLRVNPWDPVSLELGPTVASVQAFDVIADIHHQKRWLVTQVTCRKTARGVVLGWDVNARVIEPHEPYNALALRPAQTPRLNGPKLTRWHPGGNAF